MIRKGEKAMNQYIWNVFTKTGSVHIYLLLREFEEIESI
ncbi:YqzL family protein [Niallia sp. Krafla_26]